MMANLISPTDKAVASPAELAATPARAAPMALPADWVVGISAEVRSRSASLEASIMVRLR
ncbi:hypothetical protein D9M68_940830 [compost metagenome]